MRHYFSPEADQSTDILRPMNPMSPIVASDVLTPTRDMSSGYGVGGLKNRPGNRFWNLQSTRQQPSFGMLGGGVQDALAVLSFTDSILRG